MNYKVIGPCEVAGVAPGGTVTRGQLEAAGATNIDALVGPHLEQLPDADTGQKSVQEAAAKKGARGAA